LKAGHTIVDLAGQVGQQVVAVDVDLVGRFLRATTRSSLLAWAAKNSPNCSSRSELRCMSDSSARVGRGLAGALAPGR
jgi:hypothetical protein